MKHLVILLSLITLFSACQSPKQETAETPVETVSEPIKEKRTFPECKMTFTAKSEKKITQFPCRK